MYPDPNEALSHPYSLFRSVLDSHAPLKKTASQEGILTGIALQTEPSPAVRAAVKTVLSCQSFAL